MTNKLKKDEKFIWVIGYKINDGFAIKYQFESEYDAKNFLDKIIIDNPDLKNYEIRLGQISNNISKPIIVF
ncbi:MAG: hypothetical protein V1779_15600 [bacterium]